MYHFEGTRPRLRDRFSTIDAYTVKRLAKNQPDWTLSGVTWADSIDLIVRGTIHRPMPFRQPVEHVAIISTQALPVTGTMVATKLPPDTSCWIKTSSGQELYFPPMKYPVKARFQTPDNSLLVLFGISLDLQSGILQDNSVLDLIAAGKLNHESLESMIRYQTSRIALQPFLLCAAFMQSNQAEELLETKSAEVGLRERTANSE
jgi:hypothetical protein